MSGHTKWVAVKRKSLIETVVTRLTDTFRATSPKTTSWDVAPVAVDATLRFLAGKLRVKAELVMKEFNNNPRAAGLIEAAHELESYLEGKE